ncbi:MAG: hypothetical protein LRY69_00180 [Gammaproteobacteria bacterium]|nr:hypothetical protein [Gammaproteobacteria bacterium]
MPDVVIIGNALSRGNPAVEHVLTQGWYYISGPQWLYENVLRYKKSIGCFRHDMEKQQHRVFSRGF